jgi:hypothetical protein
MADYTLTPVEDQPADQGYRLTPVAAESDVEAAPPRPFIERLMQGTALTRAVDTLYKTGVLSAARQGAAEGFGSEPIGLSDAHFRQLQDAGVFRDPATGRGGALRLFNESVAQPISVLGDLAMRGGNAAVGAISAAVGQVVDYAGGTLGNPEEARNEVTNFLNYSMLRGDHQFGRVEHSPGGPTDQPVGILPRDQDFRAGAQVLTLQAKGALSKIADVAEQNLRDLWTERGIHPAEAVHDAGSDAFLHQQLTTAPDHVADRSGIAPVRGSTVPEGTPRSELFRTGDPKIDRILDDPETREAIDSPVVNRKNAVPYSAGPDDKGPGLNVDEHFPESMTVDGVTYDPAEPFAGHEFIERDVMKKLIAGGMDPPTAYKVGHFEFAEKAEGGWYRAHNIDQAKAEAAYRPFIDAIDHEHPVNPPRNLFDKPYPHDNVREPGSVADTPPTKAEIARAHAILDAAESEEAPLRAVGADVTRDMPSLARQPAPPPGRLVDAGRNAVDQLLGLSRNIQFFFDPMATGSNRAMVVAKDAMNAVRRIRWEHLRTDQDIMRRFDLEQQTRMWDAADEESVLRQEGKASEHMGLATLEPEEREAVEMLQARSQAAWLHVRDAGIVEGEGLPAYTPRMVMNVAAASENLSPRALNELGRGVFTRTSQMLHRKYLTAEETEAAAKELVGKRMAERGSSVAEIETALEKVQIARNIRALPLSTARLEEAAVWKEMINRIEDVGKAAGSETVAVGFKPGPGWFTIAGNPAFTKWEPALEKNPVTGKWGARTDDGGNVLFVPKPIYMSEEFKGPMTAILDEARDKGKIVNTAQSLYGALMTIKGKAMTAILNSPLIHNEVVWSKAMEAAGGREWLGLGLYFRGNRIVNNPGRAGELIDRGLNPMGPRGSYQDISSMMEEPSLKGHESWTGKLLSFIPGLFDPNAGAAVERAIQKAGNFVHNTLLWDRVRDLQFGLADHLSDHLVAKGADRLTADRIAAHFSNIIVGSIPKEAMSAAARASANMALFSRSFTLGNLATFKQAAFGLPKPILAQIERDAGFRAGAIDEAGELAGPEIDATKFAKSIARRKAMATIIMSVGLYYIGNALLQHAFNIVSRDSTVDAEMNGYARRYADFMKDVKADPFELRHMLGRLSPTYDNEPGKQDRAFIGYAKDGTAIYARNPTGKFGEELIGYPTMPMEMIRRKLSPLFGGILDIAENDKGFGRKIYDENDTTIQGDIKTAFAVAKHMVMRHLPEGQIDAAMDLLHGEGDPTVNKLRVFAPMFGFTASEGAPGGMARGEQLAAKSQFETRFNLAWPDIKRQILRGDMTGARDAMSGIGVPPWMQTGLINNANNPAAAVHGKVLQEFLQYATPTQRRRFENAR